MKDYRYEPWPALDYAKFKSSSHLLHMAVQAMGKLKLQTPFEPHWSNVVLWVTGTGLTTGLIPYQSGAYTVNLNMIEHRLWVSTTWGMQEGFDIISMSVAQFTQDLFAILQKFKIDTTINSMPQEITNPIPFEKDTELREYDRELANAWWRILISTHNIMQRYHSRFDGESPPIGLMWGTFDIRDARYNGIAVTPSGINAGYIRRNAMNEAQVEIGWWPGNEMYPQAAFYSFVYPQPEGIERATIKPSAAHWNDKLGEFILNYADLRQSPQPETDLLAFFESTYQAEAKLAGWSSHFITSGEPV